MMPTKYLATLDIQAKIVTNIFICIACFFLGFVVISNPISEIGYGLSFLIIPVTFLAWGFHPMYYLVDSDKITIKRPLGSIAISIQQVIEARAIDSQELTPRFRLFGSGGLFGYFGIYISPIIGKYSMWSTDKNKMVLIISLNQKFVISPSDPEAFLQDVLSKS